MKKSQIVAYDLESLNDAQSRMWGAEVKYQNILAKHGRVPSAVARELADAEAEYGFRLAMYKDDRHDPCLE